jgi:8-oxo-dGTP diphosphatase
VAVHENSELVAWAMTQDDGAMGFLHVLKKYRNRGYGRSVTVALIDKLRQQNKTPFACIEENNRNALGLVSNLGFARDRRYTGLRPDDFRLR